MTITSVVSNHEALRAMVERHDIPYYVLPITTEAKAEQEAKLLDLLKKREASLWHLPATCRYCRTISVADCPARR